MRAVALLTTALLTLAAFALVPSASAQTWSSPRGRPALWQIVAIDRTGEPGFPYGREDIAGDGLTTFDAGEAGTDLRSVYADGTAERLWLRSYVALEGGPPNTARFFFFIDSDARPDTGGPARGEVLEPALRKDPTDGGYERVVVVRGDATMLGVWEWSAPANAWLALAVAEDAVRVEFGRARDPLAIGAVERGYVQVSVAADVARLDASCVGHFFVRTWNAGMRPTAFGDDVREEAACRPAADALGDPVVLRSYTCEADAQCPASGRCREGVCLFAYDCTANEDCRNGERCTANQCVRIVDRTCSSAAECDGLACEATQCVACSESGTRACAAGLQCSPNGACVAANDFEPTGGAQIDNIQGGAFHCTAGRRADGAGGWALLSVMLGLLGRRMRTKRAGSAGKGGQS
jgi:hypothetical protein